MADQTFPVPVSCPYCGLLMQFVRRTDDRDAALAHAEQHRLTLLSKGWSLVKS